VVLSWTDDAAAAETGDLSVTCRFFARYAEMAGRDTIEISLPRGATVRDAIGAARACLDGAAGLPAVPLVAVNREHADPDRVLGDGDEVAFLPPLAGG
jgi:molybdopterin synthase catalytic subunit